MSSKQPHQAEGRQLDGATTRCIVCGQRDGFDQIADRLRDSKEHRVVRCRECGMIQINPLPTPEQERKFYDENQQAKNIGKRTDIEYLNAAESYDTKRRSKLVSNRFPRGSRVLDVGCGSGFFLAEMCYLGYQVTGVEISRERRKIAEKVTAALILDVNLLDNPPGLGLFDVITMTHVVEHLPDPIGMCNIARQYLADQGCLVVEVPNLGDLMLESCEPYRSFWWQRAHLGYFDSSSLRHVLLEAGYTEVEIVGVQRYGLENMMNWLVDGKPQIESPVFETKGPYRWLERDYKSYLEATLKCDTLVAVAHGGKKVT